MRVSECRIQSGFMGRDGKFHRNSRKALIKTDVKLAYEYLLNVSAKEGIEIFRHLAFLMTMCSLPPDYGKNS